MAEKINMLDCTLRDGGYVNDWNFGHSTIINTYKRLDDSGIEYIEIGFLDERRPFDINRTITPNTNGFNEIFSNVKKKQAIPVAMIDFGTCSLDNITPSNESFIEGIRVIFKKEKIEQALPYCQKIKEKGYKLFIQAISITSYSIEEMIEYIKKINIIKPYAFSIVDTYGLLDKDSLTSYFKIIDYYLNPEIKIGYHSHNNFQLAFSNTSEMARFNTSRELILDSTAYGMGKSAGNCPSELLAMHLNNYYKKAYNLNQILEIIDTNLMPIYNEKYWGYKYDFYISAMQNCHPNYVQFLLNKNTLTISSINEILSKIPKDKKLLYDENFIKESYINYQNIQFNDNEIYKKLKDIISRSPILLIGPGLTIKTYKNKINEFISKENPYIISLNFNPHNINNDLLFISNSKRYSKIADISLLNTTNHKTITIATSNITQLDYPIDYMLNYASLCEKTKTNSDNSLILCLYALLNINKNNIYLAGCDGFSHNDLQNYYNKSLIYEKKSKSIEENNKNIKMELDFLKTKMNIYFLTPSKYENGKI